MAESVDALVSNTNGAIRAGSIPAQGTDRRILTRESSFFGGGLYKEGARATPGLGCPRCVLGCRVDGVCLNAINTLGAGFI